MKGVQHSILWVDQKALVGLNRARISKSVWVKTRPGARGGDRKPAEECSRSLCQVTGTCQYPGRAGIAEALVGSHTDCCVRDPVLSSNGECMLRVW